MFCLRVSIIAVIALTADAVRAQAMPDWWRPLAPALAALAGSDPGVAALTAESAAARHSGRAAQAPPDPMVAVGIQALPTDFSATREAMTQAPLVSVSQAIPFPGKLRARGAVQQAQAAVADARADAMAQMRGVALAGAAFAVAQLKAERQAVDQTLAWLELLAGSVATRYDTGRGLAADVDQVRVEVGRTRAEASLVQAAAAAAQAKWARLALSDAPPPLPVAAAWQPPAELTATVADIAPAVRVQLAHVAVGAERRREARSGYGPDVLVEVAYGVRYQDRRDFLTGRVGLTLPLWAMWSQRQRVAAAEQSQAAADASALDAAREAVAELQRLLAAHTDAVYRERLYRDDILPAVTAARLSAAGAYEAGAADVFAPIEAVRRELLSRREAARVTAERRTVEAQILALAGRLVSAAAANQGDVR